MENSEKKFILVAGEASGDMHGAHLALALKSIDPNIKCAGLGGHQMESAGVEIYHDLTKMAVVGFWEVLRHYGSIKKIFNQILEKIDENKPDAVILIDYPGFNLRLAKEVKKRGIKVIYYISPQVWAWKKNRVNFIKDHVDQMLVLFPFEVDLYKQFGVEVEYVGHPLVDNVQVRTQRESFLSGLGLKPEVLTIGLLPGSRQKEIETLLPLMLNTARVINDEFSNIQYLIVKAPSITKSAIEDQLDLFPLASTIVEDNTYDAVNACDICMVASGTATLEVALLQKPMVVAYKTSLFTWILAKLFVKIKDIGLVNVIAGERIVPECVQFQATPKNMAAEVSKIFTNEPYTADIKVALKRVKNALGEGGASRRAAQAILDKI